MAKKKATPSEKSIQNKIIKWLNSQKGIWAVKFPGINRRGVPDIICCVQGDFVAFEVKTEIGKATPIQIATIKQIKQCFGEAHVVRSLEEVKGALGCE